MADKRRFEAFANFIVGRFSGSRIFDIAGGMGMLNQELTARGRLVTTFDTRHKHLPVTYVIRELSLEEPCDADLVVGLHPDGATRAIIEYAARHRIPFAIVPCCSDNSMSYKPWMRFLADEARRMGFDQVSEVDLPIEGRCRVIVGEWLRSPSPDAATPTAE